VRQAEGLVQCLKGDGENPVDEGLQLNAAAGISVLAQKYSLFFYQTFSIGIFLTFVF